MKTPSIKSLLIEQQRTWNNPKKHYIAKNMLERYTGSKAKDFQKHIILTNFEYYMHRFSRRYDVPLVHGSVMRVAHSPALGVSIVDFKIGSPTAALVIEMLSSISPDAVLMLGMCGGLHRDLKIGDFVLPIAAIRDEGTSIHFMPPQVPALPAFKIQKFLSQIIVEKNLKYQAGVIHTTDYRFWEFDDEFKATLIREKVAAIEMECSALFVTAFSSKVPCGALLLVSDLPLKKIKTKSSAKKVFREFTDQHLEIGVQAMSEIDERGDKVRHFEW